MKITLPTMEHLKTKSKGELGVLFRAAVAAASDERRDDEERRQAATCAALIRRQLALRSGPSGP